MYLAITYLNHKHDLKLLGIATTDPILAKKWGNLVATTTTPPPQNSAAIFGPLEVV